MARVQYLDGLRGWASLVVVIHHVLMSFYPALYWRMTQLIHTNNGLELVIHGTPLSLLMNGGLAVAVFLVLSGYVLTMQFKKTEPTNGTLSYFSINRFVRFFLLMLATNLLAYGVMVGGFAGNIQAAAITQSWGWLGSQWQMIPSLINAFFQSAVGLFTTFPIDQVYNSSVWTMPIFFLGGLLAALIFQLTSSLKHKWVIYGLLLLILINSNYYLLVVGMILFEFKLFSHPVFSHPLVQLFLLLLFSFFGGYPYFSSTSHFSSWYAWLPILNFTYTPTFYHGIAATSLLMLLINNGWLQRLFSIKAFTYFGTRSFSLYLVHVVVILSLMSKLFITFIPHYVYSVAFGISLGISLLVIWGLTELLYQTVEKRSSVVAKYLYQRLGQKVQ